MDEPRNQPTAFIREAEMLARLAQSEQMREFFIQMWLQNPALASRTGPRMQAMLAAGPSEAASDFADKASKPIVRG